MPNGGPSALGHSRSGYDTGDCRSDVWPDPRRARRASYADQWSGISVFEALVIDTGYGKIAAEIDLSSGRLKTCAA